MSRGERAQWARLDLGGVRLLTNLAAGVDLSRAVEFTPDGLRVFGVGPASLMPVERGDFIGSVMHGGSCNCPEIHFVPHCHGTHTEGVGHLTTQMWDVQAILPRGLLPTPLLSVTPVAASASGEAVVGAMQPTDLVITRALLEEAWPKAPDNALPARAVAIRTLPNSRRKYLDPADGSDVAPYLTAGATTWLVEKKVQHLILDLPSADRLEDGGALVAHRLFFGMPPGAKSLSAARRSHCTITELACMPDELADGWYLLSLQTGAMSADAIPSRPMLYPFKLD